jgi:hypothetical protein
MRDTFAETWSTPRSPAAAVYHAGVFLTCAWLSIAAGLLRVRPDGRIEFLFAPGRPLPEVCQTRARLGLPCPGCGLTRCLVHAAHADFSAAAGASPVGLLLCLGMFLQLPYRLWRLWRPVEVVWRTRDLLVVLISPVLMLWVQWGVRLFWPG